ncbi:MAG: hypothetical protein ABSD74_07945 [Rhizomicrobium sp.]
MLNQIYDWDRNRALLKSELKRQAQHLDDNGPNEDFRDLLDRTGMRSAILQQWTKSPGEWIVQDQEFSNVFGSKTANVSISPDHLVVAEKPSCRALGPDLRVRVTYQNQPETAFRISASDALGKIEVTAIARWIGTAILSLFFLGAALCVARFRLEPKHGDQSPIDDYGARGRFAALVLFGGVIVAASWWAFGSFCCFPLLSLLPILSYAWPKRILLLVYATAASVVFRIVVWHWLVFLHHVPLIVYVAGIFAVCLWSNEIRDRIADRSWLLSGAFRTRWADVKSTDRDRPGLDGGRRPDFNAGALGALHTFFEPPGAVFAIIGILGTFLGLGLALSDKGVLDLIRHLGEARQLPADEWAGLIRGLGVSIFSSLFGTFTLLAARLTSGRFVAEDLEHRGRIEPLQPVDPPACGFNHSGDRPVPDPPPSAKPHDPSPTGTSYLAVHIDLDPSGPPLHEDFSIAIQHNKSANTADDPADPEQDGVGNTEGPKKKRRSRTAVKTQKAAQKEATGAGDASVTQKTESESAKPPASETMNPPDKSDGGSGA